MHMRSNQPHGYVRISRPILKRLQKRNTIQSCVKLSSNYTADFKQNVDFRFCVVWPIAWFDYFTLEIVRREASKIWTRYNGGKAGSYSTMHASVHENEMWNNILSTRSSLHCHLQKVAYSRCSFLVLSASSRLYWKRSAPVGSGLRDYEWSVMPTDHLHLWSVIVIKRAEFDWWPQVISTSVLPPWICLQNALCGHDTVFLFVITPFGKQATGFWWKAIVLCFS